MSRPIKIQIVGDEKDLLRAFRSAEGGMKGMLGPVGKLAAAMGGLFAIDKIKDAGTALFELGAGLQDQNQKISTVFGDQEENVRAWADSWNEAFGSSRTEVALMAANIGDLLKPMGMTTEQATEMSKELVELSPALAEWSGGTATAAEVSEILAKAMLGEREQLKSLGIAINSAEVDQRALAIAQAEGREEVNNLDKALATQQLIFEKSTDAQDGFVTGTHTLAGAQNLLKARFADGKEFLAKQLIPVFHTVTLGIIALVAAFQEGDVSSDGFIGKMEQIGAFLGFKVLPAAQEAIATFRTWLPTIKAVATQGFQVLLTVGRTLFTILKEGYNFLDANREVLVAAGIVIGGALVAAFTAWAVSAGAAAISTLAAAAPIIALGVAITALIALVIKLYRENDTFRAGVDKVASVLRDRVWPWLKKTGDLIRDVLVVVVRHAAEAFQRHMLPQLEFVWHIISTKVIPAIVAVARKIGEWIPKVIEVQGKVNDFVRKVVGFIASVAPSVARGASRLYDALVGPFRDAFAWIEGKWRDLKNLLNRGIDVPNPFSGFSLPGFAMGTSSAPGGLARVGERGPEVVSLPRGAQVHPAHMSRGNRTGNTFIINSQASATRLADEIAWRQRVGDGR